MWNLINEEVAAVLRPLTGVPQRMASLLYGSGLRRLGCRPLRIHDIDFARNQIVVRGGKAHKDRVTILPEAAKTDRARHLEGVRAQHQRDFTREPGGSNWPPRSPGSIPMLARVGVAVGVSSHAALSSPGDGPVAPAAPAAVQRRYAVAELISSRPNSSSVASNGEERRCSVSIASIPT